MHELSITEGLLKLAISKAIEAGGSRITALHVVIGDFSAIMDDSVSFYWDMITAETIAAGSTLDFVRKPATIRCHACNIEYQPPRGDLLCPQCGGAQVSILTGDEFFLESIEIE